MNPGPASADLAAPRLRLWTALAGAVIVAAGIIVYSNSLSGPFIFDDAGSVQGNLTIRHFPDWRNLAPPRGSPFLRRPIVNLTFALNFALGGPHVTGYHVTNLMIHLCAALLLFGVVRRTLSGGRWTTDDRGWTIDAGLWTKEPRAFVHRQSPLFHSPWAVIAASFIIALIWAIHPLLTESVTYLTQRTESLMGMFYLLTLYGAIRGASSAHPWRWYSLSIAACALGMGSKEVMTTAPVIVLLYDRCFMSGSFREALRQRRAFYLGLAVTWVIFIALLIAYPWGASAGQGFGFSAMTPWQYARTQAGIILHYFRLSIWPRGLTLDYAWPIANSLREILPACAAIVVLLAGTVWALRRRPALGFLGAWIFLILAPSSSFVPIPAEVAAERRMYLPLAAIVAGCVLAACWMIERVADRSAGWRFPARAAAIAIVLSVAVTLGHLTFARNDDYRSAISIWKAAVAAHKDNFSAQSGLGGAYLAAGRYEDAIGCFNRAVELNPEDYAVYVNRAAAYTEAGRIAEAFSDLYQARELDKDSPVVHWGLAAVHMRVEDYKAAFAEYDQVIAAEPNSPEAYNKRGVAFETAGKLNEALQDYNQAIALKPDFAVAYNNRGMVYSRSAERLADAIGDYTRAISIEPDFAQAFCNRANAYLWLKRYDLAASDCDKVLDLDPNFRDAYLNRAAAYAHMGEFRKALRDVREFRRMGGQPPDDYVKGLEQAAERAK